MGVTTRKGYRKTLVAKQYQAEIFKRTGKKINLRDARKQQEAVEKLRKALAGLSQRQAVKIVRATAILLDLDP